jgi:hypothetical protein
LGQVRADIKEFLESLGLDPVLSEFASFPINPSHDTIKNCREAVKNRADIFILVVGGRYGAVADNGRSVTNLEYVEAKAKGIPIYIFVAKNIISVLPVWRKNKEADFSEVVDSNRLFEFVESLRDTKDNWVFSFESAQDICTTLKNQLAYLFMDCLDLRSRIMPGILDDQGLSEVSPKALQIMIQKPKGWEYKLFSELLKDYIEKHEDIRRDLSYGVSFGKRTVLKNLNEVVDWVMQHLSHITNTITSSTKLLNDGLPIAFGEPGQPGDAKHIHYIVKRFTDGYRRLIEWRLEFLNIDADDNFSRLFALTSAMASNVISEIEEFAKHIHKEVNLALDNIDKYEEGTVLKLTLTLTVPDPSELLDELEKVKRKYL